MHPSSEDSRALWVSTSSTLAGAVPSEEGALARPRQQREPPGVAECR